MNAADLNLDCIYQLLPAVVRESDTYAGQTLQALLRVINEQANIVEADIAGLLDNWFVETCEEWVLPYIGELVGYGSADGQPPTRAELASAVRFRRRKGSLLLLEEIAVASAGWPARAVEMRQQMAVAWSARFPSAGAGRFAPIRDADAVNRARGPFDAMSRLPDIRRLASTRTPGLGNVQSVALYVWRAESLVVEEGALRRIEVEHHDRDLRHLERFTFDPFGINRPLCIQPEPLPERTEPASELEVPSPLRRRALQGRLDRYYGKDKSLQLSWSTLEGNLEEIPAEEVVVADLENWELSLDPDDPMLDDDCCHPVVAIDPERGRALFRRKSSLEDSHLWARHHIAGLAGIGGGSYFRVPFDLPATQPAIETWYVRKPNSPADRLPGPANVYGSLQDALDAWKKLGDKKTKEKDDTPRNVVIEIEDDGDHRIGPAVGNSVTLTEIRKGEWLGIRAAPHRRPMIRPAIERKGAVWRIKQTTDNPDELSGSFLLDGIWLSDYVLTIDGPMQHVRLRHCTLFAERLGRGKILELDQVAGCLSIAKCIVLGSIHVDPKGWHPEKWCAPKHKQVDTRLSPHEPLIVRVTDSVLDGDDCDENVLLSGLRGPKQTVHAPAFADLHFARCTVFGLIRAHGMPSAEDSLFVGDVEITTVAGCMRRCSIPAKLALSAQSRTPPRYACQPDLAIERAREEAGADLLDPEKAAVANRVAPRFASRLFGDVGYATLHRDCPEEILRGAEDGSEMGAYHALHLGRRERLLRARLNEFVTAGADAQVLLAD